VAVAAAHKAIGNRDDGDTLVGFKAAFLTETSQAQVVTAVI
jgi:hypothetical protein